MVIAPGRGNSLGSFFHQHIYVWLPMDKITRKILGWLIDQWLKRWDERRKR